MVVVSLRNTWTEAPADFIYHVNAKVNQYAILQATRTTLSGSQMPLVASSSARELDARSMGTRSMMLMGRVRARKMGTKR